MGQITATRNLVAIKVVRHAGQWLVVYHGNSFLLQKVLIDVYEMVYLIFVKYQAGIASKGNWHHRKANEAEMHEIESIASVGMPFKDNVT